MKRQHGVTLIELIVTLVVLGVLVSIAAPSFRSIRDVNRVKAAAEAVYAHLQFARSEAIKQNRDLFVQVTPGYSSYGEDWCLGIADFSGCDCMEEDKDEADFCEFGPAGARIERTLSSGIFEGISLWSNRAEIQFEGRRGMDPTNGTIRIKDDAGWTVSVKHSRRGRISLCTGEGVKEVRGYPEC